MRRILTASVSGALLLGTVVSGCISADGPPAAATGNIPGVSIVIVSIEGRTSADYEHKPSPQNWAPDRIYVGNTGTITSPVAAPPTIIITARVTPVPSKKWLYWSYRDPPEPSGAIPSNTGTADDDNKGRLPAEPFSAVAGWRLEVKKRATALDAQGVTKIAFTATTYGGNNYIIGAGIEAGKDNTSTFSKSGTQTPVLTVWKRIRYEPLRRLVGYSAYDLAFDDVFFTGVRQSLAKMYVEPVFASTALEAVIDPARGEFINGGAYGPNSEAAFLSLARAYRGSTSTITTLLVRGESADCNMLDDARCLPLNLTPFVPASWMQYQWGGFDAGADHFIPTEQHSGGVGKTDSPRNFVLLYMDELALEALIQWRRGRVPDYLSWFRRNVLVSFLHESGHALGLQHQEDNIYSSMMSPRADFSSQFAWNFFSLWVDGAEWAASDGLQVRERYVPLTQ
jgi:hypothetical protein